MEASERGELSPEETDDKLREVVESAVQGQVDVGREIGSSAMDEDEDGANAVRPRDDEDPNGSLGDERPVGGKRRKEEAGR